MSDFAEPTTDRQCLSPAELRKLPEDERNAILEAQAALAEDVYRSDPTLTDFEAFGEDDLRGDISSAEAG